MRRRRGELVVGLMVATAVGLPPPSQAATSITEGPLLGGLPAVAAPRDLSTLPLLFEANHGQWSAGAAFGARAATGLSLEAHPGAPVIRLGAARLRLTLDGARNDVAPTADQPRRAVVNVFRGNDPSRWVQGARTFGAVRYAGLRPGVDLVLHGDGRELEYDLEVAPDVDVRDLAVRMRGAQRLRLDRRGDLLVSTGGGTLRQRRPVAFQGGRRIKARFVLRGDGRVRFAVGAYDRSKPLTIDPTLVYATYFGGAGNEFADDVAIDSTGASYVVGSSGSNAFAGTGQNAGGMDAFVAKFDAAGQLNYATWLGGPGDDYPGGVAVEISSGRVVVAGRSFGCGFPMAGVPFDATCTGSSEGWAARLDAAGVLTDSTYIGGDGPDSAADVARTPTGDWVIAGGTTSATGFPTAGPSTTYGINGDFFITRLPANLRAPAVYSEFFGGAGSEGSTGDPPRLAVDGSGNAYLGGLTGSTGLGLGTGADTTQSGNDLVVARFSAAGIRQWTTYLGSTTTPGFGSESLAGLVVTAGGKLLVAGDAPPPGFLPGSVLTGAYQSSPAGHRDGFIARMPLDQPVLEAASYLGGADYDHVEGVAGSASSDWVVVGKTMSDDFPLTPGAYDTSAGADEGFLAALDSNGTALRYGTRLNTPGTATAVALRGQTAHVVVSTGTAGFPVTPDAYDASANGNFDLLLLRLDWQPPETTITSQPSSPTNDTTPTFTFSSDDSSATFQCRLSIAFSTCTSPRTLGPLSDGTYSIDVRAVDAAGNLDASPDTATVVIDTVAPETAIDSGPSGVVSNARPSFSFSSTSRNVTFTCRFDTAAFAPCTSPFQPATALTQGAHTFQVRAQDEAGNLEQTPAARTFTVDTIAPDTTATGPQGVITTRTPSVMVASTEANSTFACTLNNTPLPSCPASQQLGPLADGLYTFRARAKDVAGNEDGSPATLSFIIDATAPDTTITGGPSGETNDPTPTFTFTSSEAGGSFTCAIDNVSTGPCTTNTPVSAVGDGLHTFTVTATDAAGNTDPSPAERGFIVDTVAPDTSLDSGPGPVTSDPRPTLTFSSPERFATFSCTLDGVSAACASPFRPASDLADGSHTFSVAARDGAGNQDATPPSRTFTVETRPPDTTIAGPSLTNQTRPAFALSATEAATFECALDGAPPAVCAADYTPTTPQADGPHVLRAWAIDGAGNRDPDPASLAFIIDTVAPETAIATGSVQSTTDARPTFTLLSEAGARFECALDLSGYEPCANPYQPVFGLADGPHVLRVRAIDPAGNIDPTPAEKSFTIGTAPIPNQFATLGASALVLACDKSRIVLIDVVPSGRKVRLTGAATAATFAGKAVDVLLDGRKVASANVAPDGAITALVPGPARKRRSAARYQLRTGATRSRNVKLNRRTLVTSIAVEAGRVVIRGQLTGPLPKRPVPITFRRQTSCTDYELVGTVTPSRQGRYTVRLPLPAAPVKAAIYRGETKVAVRAGKPATKRSFTLARAVNVR